jgi:hypothetical protein
MSLPDGISPLKSYKDGLLETEARIQIEDDDHIVIALRLRKDVIRQNLPFLAALFGAVDHQKS